MDRRESPKSFSASQSTNGPIGALLHKSEALCCYRLESGGQRVRPITVSFKTTLVYQRGRRENCSSTAVSILVESLRILLLSS